MNEVDDLSEQDGAELLVNYGTYAKQYDPDVDPENRQVRSVEDIQSDLERLAAQDNVKGLAEAIRSSTLSAESDGSIPSLKGLDGEADAATTLLDNENVEVEELEVGGEDGITATINGKTRESEVDIDADLTNREGDVDVAIESKNFDYDDRPMGGPVFESAVEDLENKFNVLSRTRDEIVIVSRTARDNPRNNRIISEALNRATFPSDFDPDSDIHFITYDQLSALD